MLNAVDVTLLTLADKVALEATRLGARLHALAFRRRRGNGGRCGHGSRMALGISPQILGQMMRGDLGSVPITGEAAGLSCMIVASSAMAFRSFWE
jgi:hypothetical protein